MKKTIPAPIAIIILLLLTLSTIGFVIYQHWLLLKEISTSPIFLSSSSEDEAADLTEKGQACVNSGGTVRMAMCCESTGDFPNLCLIGPCGCSPDNSHEVKICECEEGKCFDGESCVIMD